MEDTNASHISYKTGEALLCGEANAEAGGTRDVSSLGHAVAADSDLFKVAATSADVRSDAESLMTRCSAIRRSGKRSTAELQPLSAAALRTAKERLRGQGAASSADPSSPDAGVDVDSSALTSAGAAVSHDGAAGSFVSGRGAKASIKRSKSSPSASAFGSASNEADSSDECDDSHASESSDGSGNSDESDGSDGSDDSDGSSDSDESDASDASDCSDALKARCRRSSAGQRIGSAASRAAKQQGGRAPSKAWASRDAAAADTEEDRIDHAVKAGLPHPDPRHSHLMPV